MYFTWKWIFTYNYRPFWIKTQIKTQNSEFIKLLTERFTFSTVSKLYCLFKNQLIEISEAETFSETFN